jgi:class 3 adenylate cyclase/tetratricopeptide (TPR) repeat protein
MTCSFCGTENPAGRKFCGSCGQPLAVVCPVCGTPNEPRFRFCGECGSALSPGDSPAPVQEGAPATIAESPSITERRLVSVLFADLVGFTPFSESRDPDDVRELLSRYFELGRRIVTRYGGTIEKFIGDAIMAVWGAPTAKEDDAERAVRAALDLVDAVPALGAEAGAPDLRMRAGVITGEASVNLGAEGQGMVAGDAVNTASRVQAVAQPGSVLVGDATRRATEAAIVYEAAGDHELNGKAEPVPLFRPVRIIGGIRGALRSERLEAPFVGRDRELRLVKDLYHTSTDDRRAHLLLVSGIAGIGKSRLGWEFYKYVDGLEQLVYWHRGRCPAYGEGVTYWALAEMVRFRARIAEGEDPAEAMTKLRATTEDFLPDVEERAWVESRLAYLLGLGDVAADPAGGRTREPEDLFSAWRVFFERLADRAPTVLVFEDLQWADGSLLEFIEYLMTWSRTHPIFVIGLARPDLAQRLPDWASARRATTALHLEPLSEADMHRLLTGLVPGLPDSLERQILDRAEGVPLYAMETVRMLMDRGLLELDVGESAYRLTGPVETLDVPETLHALIAARLDGLSAEERTLVQTGAVLGKTFTKEALATLTGGDAALLEPLLGRLVRNEILFVQADTRSPERGQYGFLQDLVRRIAYETLSKKERRSRHLAVATYLERTYGPDDPEVVEVLASHLLEAFRIDPAAADANEVRARARDALLHAARRSESLAAAQPAYHYLLQAIELTDDPVIRAGLHERAGWAAFSAGHPPDMRPHLEAAIEGFEGEGRTREAARVIASLGAVAFGDGRFDEARVRIQQAYDALEGGEPDETLARVASELGRVLLFMGRRDDALPLLERALGLAEGFDLPEVFAQTLNTKAVLLYTDGRHEEALVLLRHALQVSLEHNLSGSALRALNNLSSCAGGIERFDEAAQAADQGLELARRLGDRSWEFKFLVGGISIDVMLGGWDEALRRAEAFESSGEDIAAFQGIVVELLPAIMVYAARGDLDAANGVLDRAPRLEEVEDVQVRLEVAFSTSVVRRAEGRLKEALELALAAAEARQGASISAGGSLKLAIVAVVENCLDLEDLSGAGEALGWLEALPPGHVTPFLRGAIPRLHARIAAARGEDEPIDAWFKAAVEAFRAVRMPFFQAVTLLEHAEWLIGRGRAKEAGPALNEAHEIFQTLRARPWLERAERASAGQIGRVAAAAEG